MTEAKVIAHSITERECELVTFQVRFPYIILNQVRTYGMLSYSVRSMRAVPTSKLIQEVELNPFVPKRWNERVKGMVAGAELSEMDQGTARDVWLMARDESIAAASALDKLRAAKEHVNRLLTPFCWADAVITGTADELRWMIYQRTADDAQPEFQELAREMDRVWSESTPEEKRQGEWHLPYIDWRDKFPVDFTHDQVRLVSAARCARVSYFPFDSDKRDWVDDLRIAGQLLSDKPHLSPFEHQAMATNVRRHHGKLFGWLPNRLLMGY